MRRILISFLIAIIAVTGVHIDEARADLTTNLVHYWKLDGNSNDAVGSDNGTDTNITYSAGNGIIGQGAGMTNGVITIPSTTGYNSFSTNIWFKTSNTSLIQYFYNKDDSGSNRCWALGYYGSIGQFTAYYWNAAGTNINNSWAQTLSNNTWYMVTVTWDAAGYAIAYVDGVEKSRTLTGGNAKSANTSITIGRQQGGGTPLSGAVDEPSLYSRVLTPTEITELYNSGSGKQYPFSGGATVIRPSIINF